MSWLQFTIDLGFGFSQGLFWSNLFIIIGLTVSDGSPENNVHWDNFTVAAAYVITTYHDQKLEFQSLEGFEPNMRWLQFYSSTARLLGC